VPKSFENGLDGGLNLLLTGLHHSPVVTGQGFYRMPVPTKINIPEHGVDEGSKLPSGRPFVRAWQDFRHDIEIEAGGCSGRVGCCEQVEFGFFPSFKGLFPPVLPVQVIQESSLGNFALGILGQNVMLLKPEVGLHSQVQKGRIPPNDAMLTLLRYMQAWPD
jgi:hypothetical protein